MKPTILFIIGSLRKESLNRQLANAAIEVIGERAETPILAWADVPIFDQDQEFPAPESVERVRKAVEEADAIWFASPEYNHGVPGGLKNLIDWLSRPPAEGKPAVLMGKIATVSTISGSSCGRYVHGALLPTFGYLKIQVPGTSFTSASFDRTEFTTSKLEVTEVMKGDLTRQVDALLAKIPQ